MHLEYGRWVARDNNAPGVTNGSILGVHKAGISLVNPMSQGQIQCDLSSFGFESRYENIKPQVQMYRSRSNLFNQTQANKIGPINSDKLLYSLKKHHIGLACV